MNDEATPLLRAANLGRRSGVAAGFTTRHGGVSTGALSSLNLGRRPDERPDALRENWSRVARALDGHLGAGDVALLSQVHGAAVVRVSAPSGPVDALAEADAAYTTEAGRVLAVRVADCVPVLVAARGGVAVAHAGWRGTAAGVVPAVVRALAEATGEDPSTMSVAIGPHISAEVYEVGPEVIAAFVAGGLDPARFVVTREGWPKPHVDLGAALAQQLERIGVTDVELRSPCTVRDDRFYSHRRDGAGTGRMAGVIARLA